MGRIIPRGFNQIQSALSETLCVWWMDESSCSWFQYRGKNAAVTQSVIQDKKKLSDYLSNDKKAGTFNGRLSCQDKLDKRNTASHWSCRRFSLVSGLFIQSFNFLFQKPLLKNEKGVIWFSIDRNTRQFSFSLSKERSEIWKALRDGGRLDFPGRSWPRLLKWDQCSSCTWKASLARASSSSPRAHGCPCLELRLSPNTSM